MTYTVYSRAWNGKLSHKEHLNNIDELNEWLEKVSSKFTHCVVVQDQTGKRKFGVISKEGWVFQSTPQVYN
jgi:hypothetical protein